MFGTHLRHLGDNFWTTDNFGTIWWLLSDCWQSIPLPRGQHIGIFKIRFYSILQHFERCECPICPNQKNCVTFNFQVYCSRLYLHSVHIANCLYPRIHKGAPWCHTWATFNPFGQFNPMGQNGSIFKCQNFNNLLITAHPCWFIPSAGNFANILVHVYRHIADTHIIEALGLGSHMANSN